MDFAAVESGLPTLFTSLMGIPCQWATQPRRMVVGTSAVIDILGDTVNGRDERVTSYVDDDGAIVGVADATGARETIYGQRELTLQVTIWGITQQLVKSARYYLGRLRTRIRFTSSIARLKAMGLFLSTRENIVQVDPAQEGRAMSQASLDLHFGYGVAESDEPAAFVKTVRVKSEFLENAAGDPEPPSLQSDITVEIP